MSATAPPSSTHATLTMRANRRRNTKPEIRIRSRLHRSGARFRVDHPIRTSRGLVRPDIVFSRARVAVFVDGCYWHACPEHGELHRSNRAFWRRKFAANATRDRAQTAALRRDGWTVLRVWEHEDPDAVATRIAALL